MAITYDASIDRFRDESGQFVSRSRGLKSRVARAHYYAAQAGKEMLSLEKDILREIEEAERERLKEEAIEATRRRRGLEPGESYIPPDAKPLPGYPGVYVIPSLPDVLIPQIVTTESADDFWHSWIDEFASYMDEFDDEVES